MPKHSAARRFRIAVTYVLLASFALPNVALAQAPAAAAGGCNSNQQMRQLYHNIRKKKLNFQWNHLDKFKKPSLNDDYQNNVPEGNMQNQMGPPSDTFQDSWPQLQGLITLIINLIKGLLKKQGGHGVGIPGIDDVIGKAKDAKTMDAACAPEPVPWADWRKVFPTPGAGG
jgi:hypothetical protein